MPEICPNELAGDASVLLFMKNLFLLFIALGAGLTFFSARQPGKSCEACRINFTLPDFAPLKPTPNMSLPYPAPPPPEDWTQLKPQERLANVRRRVRPLLAEELKKQGLSLGNPAFVRIFKESRELELWLRGGTEWKLFRSYPVAAMSGTLGPKTKEGDGQAPEGFYAVTRESLNPSSSYHLSFNIGYPNAYDRHHRRTGSFIMVHGNEVSIGCFAMTDPVIEEIYLIVDEALKAGQAEVPVHAFPFHLTEERLAGEKDNAAASFWRELQPGYAAFTAVKEIPQVTQRAGRYTLR